MINIEHTVYYNYVSGFVRELNAVESIGKHSRMNDDSRVGISEQAVMIKVNQFLMNLEYLVIDFQLKEYSVARSKKYMCNLPVRS